MIDSNLIQTATLLINDFHLKGRRFPIFKVEQRNVWLLIDAETLIGMRLEPDGHIQSTDGVAIRFPALGVSID